MLVAAVMALHPHVDHTAIEHFLGVDAFADRVDAGEPSGALNQCVHLPRGQPSEPTVGVCLHEDTQAVAFEIDRLIRYHRGVVDP
jgi:hypothetical protein